MKDFFKFIQTVIYMYIMKKWDFDGGDVLLIKIGNK